MGASSADPAKCDADHWRLATSLVATRSGNSCLSLREDMPMRPLTRREIVTMVTKPSGREE
jgi:hypothetical protein